MSSLVAHVPCDVHVNVGYSLQGSMRGWEGGRAALQCHLLVMVLPGPSKIVFSEGLRALQRCPCSYSHGIHIYNNIIMLYENSYHQIMLLKCIDVCIHLCFASKNPFFLCNTCTFVQRMT